MATRKKKSEKEIINEISKLAAEVTLGETETKKPKTKKKTTTTEWPKVTIGSHSVRREYEDGRVEFESDWEALQRDVREAIASVEGKKNA